MLFVILQRYEVTGTADIDAVVPFRDQYSVAILACQGSGVSVKVRHLRGSLVCWISSANRWQDSTRGACSTCEAATSRSLTHRGTRVLSAANPRPFAGLDSSN